MSNKVKLVFKRDVYKEIMAIAAAVKTEVAGMCKVVVNDEGEFVAVSNHVTKQDVHSTTAELRPEELAALDYQTMNIDGELLLWWHSHNSMGVGPSSQDVTQRRELASSAGRCLAVIVNHNENISGMYCHKVDTGVVGLPQYVEADIDIKVYQSDEDIALAERAKQIVKENVFAKVSTPAVTTGTGNWRSSLPDGVFSSRPGDNLKALSGMYYYCERGDSLDCVLWDAKCKTTTPTDWKDYFKKHPHERKRRMKAIEEYSALLLDAAVHDSQLEAADPELINEINLDKDYWTALYMQTYQMSPMDDDLCSLYAAHKNSNTLDYQYFLAQVQEDVAEQDSMYEQQVEVLGVMY